MEQNIRTDSSLAYDIKEFTSKLAHDWNVFDVHAQVDTNPIVNVTDITSHFYAYNMLVYVT